MAYLRSEKRMIIVLTQGSTDMQRVVVVKICIYQALVTVQPLSRIPIHICSRFSAERSVQSAVLSRVDSVSLEVLDFFASTQGKK